MENNDFSSAQSAPSFSGSKGGTHLALSHNIWGSKVTSLSFNGDVVLDTIEIDEPSLNSQLKSLNITGNSALQRLLLHSVTGEAMTSVNYFFGGTYAIEEIYMPVFTKAVRDTSADDKAHQNVRTVDLRSFNAPFIFQTLPKQAVNLEWIDISNMDLQYFEGEYEKDWIFGTIHDDCFILVKNNDVKNKLEELNPNLTRIQVIR